MICSTIGEILDYAAERFGTGDALRYKVKKDTIESKSYRELKSDSERFSRLMDELGEKEGSHIAVTGMNSYSWLVTYLGTVCSGRVAVPLDVSLPAGDMCELIDRADVTVLVLDQLRQDVPGHGEGEMSQGAPCDHHERETEAGGGSVFR